MLIIKFNPDTATPEEIMNLYHNLRETINEEILFLPAQYEYIQNATVKDLIDIRDTISTIITTKLSSDIQDIIDKEPKT